MKRRQTRIHIFTGLSNVDAGPKNSDLDPYQLGADSGSGSWIGLVKKTDPAHMGSNPDTK